MLALREQLTGCLDERVGLGLQVPTTALLDFASVLGQSGEEGIDLLPHLGGRAKEVFAVTSSRIQSQMASSGLSPGCSRQCDQPQVQIRGRQVFPELRP